MNKKLIIGIFTLVGTIIGVGTFALPYAVQKVGVIPGLLMLVSLSILTISISLIYGKIAIATKKFHQLPEFARIYIGKKARTVAIISMITTIWGAIIAYIIIGGDFAQSFLSHADINTTLSTFQVSLIFGAICSLLILLQTNSFAKIQSLLVILKLAAIIFIIFKGLSFVEQRNITQINLKEIAFPYGIMLFALGGMSSIPILEEILGDSNKKILKTVVIGNIIPLIIYSLFIVVVVGTLGRNVTEDGITNLANVLGLNSFRILLIFGILAIITPFIALGFALKDMFILDFKVHPFLAWFFTCVPPIIFFVLGVNNFIEVIGLVGSITTGIEAIIVLEIYRRLRKKKNFLLIQIPLSLLYISGAIVQIIFFLK